MTSGEWDLRALKALEEEEQKEFLALSQKSLFEPPSPPAQAKLQQQKQQQINAQHLIHAALTERERANGQQTTATTCNATAASAAATTNYMQLQAQKLLKLPTINEHHHQHQQPQYLLKNKTTAAQENGGKVARGEGTGAGGGRLKFTKVLSLSAHSLTNRFGGGGVGGSGGGLRKYKKSSCSNSPSHYGSPLYTPPPTRRCNTLHHSQPQVRKAFKTLQQLEKQKQERKQELLNKNRTLQRIAGTNKTYWKYGINSTANSITLQHQQKLQKRKSITSELESNTSDELGSEETQPIDSVVQRLKEERELVKELAVKNVKVNDEDDHNDLDDNVVDDDDDDDDGNTDIGSCSVPLASDSIEMMSIMLTAASTAVKTQIQPLPPSLITASSQQQQPSLQPPPPPPPPPDIAATGGATTATTTMLGFNEFPKYFTLNHHNLSGVNSSIVGNEENEETVAYEAFHKMFSRRKSFAGEKMLRMQTLQRNSSLQHDVVQQQQPKQQSSLHNNNSQQAYRNVNNRPLLKSSSVEAPLSSYMDFNINSNSVIANPLTNTSSISNNNKNKINSLSNSNQKTRESFKRKLLNSPSNLLTSLPYNSAIENTTKAATTTTTICNPLCSSKLQQHLEYQQYLQQQQKPAYQHHHQQQQQAQHHLQHLLDNDLNVATTPLLSSSSAALVIDDELEEHIKQCSCSCNHMGYGNSMDYQVNQAAQHCFTSFISWGI